MLHEPMLPGYAAAMNAQRAIGVVTIGLLLLAVGFILVLLFSADTELPDDGAPEVPSETPKPVGTVPAAPAPQGNPMARQAIPAPRGEQRPKPPNNTTRANLSTEQWRDYNTAMHEVVTQAREVCIRPFAQQNNLGKVEIVMDAVLWEGQVVDFGLRGLQDTPDHVLDCIGEVAWNTQFPAHDVPGEVRLQRTLDVDGRRPTNDDIP
jgi:hypothetical protein